MLERVQLDIATAESWVGWKRKEQWCCECGRTRRTEGMRERKKMMGKQSPEPAPDARF
jgi:hypothetical protein